MMKFLPYFALALLLPGVSADHMLKTSVDASSGGPTGTEIAERVETCEPSYTSSNTPDHYFKFSCATAGKVKMIKYSDCACTTVTETQEFNDGYETGGFKYECKTEDMTGFIYSTAYTASSCASACKVEHLAVGLCLKGDMTGNAGDTATGSRKLIKNTDDTYVDELYSDDACTTFASNRADGPLNSCATPSSNMACGDGTNTGISFQYNYYVESTDASTLQDVCNGAPAGTSASSGAAALGAAAPAALSFAAAVLLSYFF